MAENYTEKRIEQQISFLEALQKLNLEQQKAVNTIEGPVLAIAGPGTGKTHILTARIGQILVETDAQAHNILCLTFTDAGVHAMRERLLSFIGPEAHRVHIYTFHSFCNKIIQEHLEVFGRHDLEPLSDLERLEIIRELLDNQDVEHPLKVHRRDPHYYEAHLQDLFRRMKSEGWTAEHVDSCIDAYIGDLPNQKEFIYQRNSGKFKKGDPKIARIAEVKKRMDRLRAAAFLFEEYAFVMQQRRRYDYEDMMLWVLKAFEEEEYLLRNYQEQYLYILVDEFQDTNGAQSQIVQHLIAYWEHRPNIFIVGDDDQSIYEFQGARVKNMLDFYQNYEEYMQVVLLQSNYRSTQKILDAAQVLIQENSLRITNYLDHLEIEKNLIAANEERLAKSLEIRFLAYRNRVQEEIGLVETIEHLNKEQGVPLNEIAIIYARHKQAQQIIRIFEKKDIPYRSKRRINILELPLIQNFLQVLTYISQEYEKPYSGEPLFFELLYSNFLGISVQDINCLSAFMALDAQQKYSNHAYQDLTKWKDLIQDNTKLEELNLKNLSAIQRLHQFLEDSIAAYRNRTLPELLELIINRSGLLYYAAKHERKDWYIQVINTLFEFAKRESLKNPILNLKGFLDVLQRMEDNRIGLGVYKTLYTTEGVNLITAHSSKGLEFRYVFIINCLKDFWEPSNENRGRRFAFPPTLTHSEDGDALEASRRLFYVAMTRAKEYLQFSYYEFNEAHKMQQRACFVDEILARTKLKIERKLVDNSILVDYQFLSFSSVGQKQNLPLLDRAIMTHLLDRFKLSVSSMNTYLNCPLSFYYEYVLRLPSLPSQEASYGTAVHNSLDRLFDTIKKYETKQLPHISELLLFFQQEMEKQRVYFNKVSYQDNLNLGMRHLPLYYEQRKQDWNQQLQEADILTEKQLRNIEVDGVPITGTIDKIIFYSNQQAKRVHLVDYKTGKLKERRLRPPTPANPEGGNYWRQLVFYKILLENSRITPYTAQTAAIDYLTPDEQGSFPLKQIRITPRDTSIVRKLIQDTYQNIKNFEFEIGCGRPSCKWCNFVDRNEMPDSFNNTEAEDMDD
ncbi:MAG: ATP-dependent helicase [Saprospiraceae bacterium]|nr:ATP-dependent helicase [Saprospiraceae bacterium]